MLDGAPGNPGTPPAGTDTPPAGNPPVGGDEHWYSSFPEDIKADPNITKFKSADELARGYINATSMLGRDKIAMPKTDEEFIEVYRALGAPATADEYKFEEATYSIPSDLYSEEEIAEDRKEYAGWAQELGLSNKQASTIYHRFMQKQQNVMGAQARAIDDEMARCKDTMYNTWGQATESNLTIANRAMDKIFGSDVAEAIAASGLGRNFAFVQGMHRMGTVMLEELGLDRNGNSTRSPADYSKEISELQAHPAYLDSDHAEHKTIQKRVMDLFNQMNEAPR